MTIIPVPDTTIEEQIERAKAQSVQRTPEVSQYGTPNYWSIAGWRGTFLSARGTLQRERELRDWYFADEQVLVRGAFTGIAKHIGNLPWEITGDDQPTDVFAGMGRELGRDTETGVEYYQQVLRLANMGAGWGQLITQVVLDYFRYDTGAFIEVIGAGDSYSPLNGPVTALAHLDPLACIPTGDPLYPVVYYDLYGGIHPMHFTRLICLQDMNDGDQRRPGWGDSALARAISIAAREMWITRYINAYLDDQPAPGLDIIGGITKGQFDQIENNFKEMQQRDVKPRWGARIRYHTPDPAINPKIESVQWQTSPEKFDFRVYTDIDVDVLALAMGIDRLDLMQLSGGGAIGSEAQSIIMHQKSKGKTIGYLITELERHFNDLLPEGFEFSFKYRDDQEAKGQADKAAVWGGFIQQTKHLFDTPEQRHILASQVEAVQDALDNQPRVNDVDIAPEQSANDTGDAVDNTVASAPVVSGTVELYKQQLDAGAISIGQYQRVTGQKVTPGFDDLFMFGGLPVPKDEVPNLWKYKQIIAPSVYNSEVITGEPLPQPVDPTQVVPSGEPGEVEAQPLDENAPAPEPKPSPFDAGQKSYEGTEADFIENVRDLLKSAVEKGGYLDKRGFSVTLRSLLKRFGLQAFKDGMRQGGVSVNDLDPEDQEFYNEAFLYQAGFVPSFAEEVFGEKGVTPAAIDTRARMWGKSLEQFVNRGRVAANGNGMYEWSYGDTEHCEDCRRLNGQVHRMKHWWNSGWLPRAGRLKCGGWLCKCQLVKTDKTAAGAY